MTAHPLGGETCGKENPNTPGEYCTKRAGHGHLHHIRGTHTTWYTPGHEPDGYSDKGYMTEGEWQAFGRYGY